MIYKDYEYPMRDRERGRDRDRPRERDRYRDIDRERVLDRERDIDRERYRDRERERGRDIDRERILDRERDLDRDKNRYKIRDERERYRESSRDREEERERNRQKRDIDRENDIIREKNREINYDKDRNRERDRRDDNYYKYKINKETRNYRKSLSRSISRHRSRSREAQRIKREREKERRSYSRKSNSKHSYRNEIIDQTIKDGIRQIEEAESFDRTILMYSFPNEVNERKIFNFFASFDILPIIDIKLLRDSRTNRSKNCCYVEFDTKDRARQAINLSGQLLCGQPCQIVSSQAEKNRKALATRLKKEKDKEKNPGLMNSNIVKYSKSNEQIDLNDAPMKIYVGGLTENLANITEDDLCNIFGFGEIDSIELHKDPITGRSKGYAFIQFHRGSKAKEVIQAMNGFVYQGKALKVGEANENNTVIKGKMYLAKQQQQQQYQQQQLQQQMQMINEQQIQKKGQDNKAKESQQEFNQIKES
jgi:RNA-binding protein 39